MRADAACAPRPRAAPCRCNRRRALRAVFESVFTFVHRPSAILYDYLFWWQIAAFVALPLALLFGLLRTRLARASIGDLVLELERTPPQSIGAALARALGDRTVEVLYWLRNEAATSIRRADPPSCPSTPTEP